MAGLVERVASEFHEVMEWSVVVTKTMAGALRYRELVKARGRLVPVPSIIINGSLEFDVIPEEQVLRDRLGELSGELSR